LDNVINVVPVKIEKEEEWIERKDPELSFSNTLQGKNSSEELCIHLTRLCLG